MEHHLWLKKDRRPSHQPEIVAAVAAVNPIVKFNQFRAKLENQLMNITSLANQETGYHPGVTDLTRLARQLKIPFATCLSAAMSELYKLAVAPLPGERADVDDLIWEISRALGDFTRNRPLQPTAGASRLLEFPSFLDGEHDAKVIRARATLSPSPGGHRLCVSTLEEGCLNLLPLVMVAEDDETLGRSVSQLLCQHEYHALWVKTGEILGFAAGYQPELILLDMGLPDAHCLAAWRELRATPGTKAISVIILSASGDDLVPALAHGAAACLEKPVKDLPAQIERVLIASGFRRGGATPG